MQPRSKYFGAGVFALAVTLMTAAASFAGPAELGRVDWIRDFESGQKQSREEGKPLFLLFQEIPGCQTCVSFGKEVLSHPLLVEAIEDEFVPVAIYNNRGGADRAILERFGEPAWNNPVVRFADAEGQDLLPRRDRVWRTAEIAARMQSALEAAGRPAPTYLAALVDELEPKRIEKATFGMHCYWEGEACLGALPGLLSSRTGSLGGREVVELRFDSTRVDYADLVREAKRRGCADAVFAHGDAQFASAQEVFGVHAQLAHGFARDASERNQKFHLKRSRGLKKLDLTPTQALKLNHGVWARTPWKKILSPRQRSQVP